MRELEEEIEWLVLEVEGVEERSQTAEAAAKLEVRDLSKQEEVEAPGEVQVKLMGAAAAELRVLRESKKAFEMREVAWAAFCLWVEVVWACEVEHPESFVCLRRSWAANCSSTQPCLAVQVRLLVVEAAALPPELLVRRHLVQVVVGALVYSVPMTSLNSSLGPSRRY